MTPPPVSRARVPSRVAGGARRLSKEKRSRFASHKALPLSHAYKLLYNNGMRRSDRLISPAEHVVPARRERERNERVSGHDRFENITGADTQAAAFKAARRGGIMEGACLVV